MSSDEEMGEVGWDVDVLKAVRVFCRADGKPVLRYLTSWVGFDDYCDEWTAKEDFGDPEQVTTFRQVIPPTFNRKKFGEIWYAPKEWVDKERASYYEENPEAHAKSNGARIKAEVERLKREEESMARELGREPFTQPRHEMQIQEDITRYNAFYKRERQGKKRKSTLRPVDSQKSKSSKPVTTSVNPLPTVKPAAKEGDLKQPTKSSNVEPTPSAPTKRKKEDRIIVGLRYKTQAISHLTGFHSNTAFDRFRARSHNGTGKSTPVARSTTSHRPRVKNKNDIVIYPPVTSRSSPASPSGSAPDSLFDELSQDSSSSSDDSIPLAHQASRLQSSSRLQRNRRAITTIVSDSSDSDAPLSKLVEVGKTKSRQEAGPAGGENTTTRQLISSTASSASKSLSHRPPHIQAPLNPLPSATHQSDIQHSPITPIQSKLRAWSEVGKLIPLGKNRQTPSEPVASSTAQLDAQTTTQARSESIIVEDPPSPPLFLGNGEDISTEMGMDVDVGPMPDPIGFMQSVVKEIPLPAPEPKTNWAPVDLIMQSTNAETELCKVVLQKVTTAVPPNLKWIHKDGFKIRSFRAQAHLKLLLLAYEPWQHARVVAFEEQDNKVVAAFTSYLYENGMFALADTDPVFGGTKLCFYPSDFAAVAESLELPPYSELRQGPLHLLVTVIKPITPREQPSVVTSKPPHRNANLEIPSVSSPTIARGLRILRMSPEIRTALQQRYPDDPKKRTYVIATVDSFGFRSYGIDNRVAEEHAANGIVHQEETLALISTMKEIGYKSRPGSDNAAVVFIHNAAFDMSKHLLGLHARKLRSKYWCFAYGPFHALEPRLWGVREIFKRGGILTFTASSVMENASQIPKLLQGIDESATWMAFISPLVVGLLQAAMLDDADNQSAMTGLFNVLEGVKAGKLSLLSAPPHPWKVEDWGKWSRTSASFSMPDDFTADSGAAQDAILDSAEKALKDFANPPPVETISECTCPEDVKKAGLVAMLRRGPLDGRALEQAVDNQVFDDLRQMLFMPVLHTEYRRFVVLRPTQAIPSDRDYKDSIEHTTFQKLVNSDRLTFGSLKSNMASMPPQVTPTSATSMQGHYVSPISG